MENPLLVTEGLPSLFRERVEVAPPPSLALTNLPRGASWPAGCFKLLDCVFDFVGAFLGAAVGSLLTMNKCSNSEGDDPPSAELRTCCWMSLSAPAAGTSSADEGCGCHRASNFDRSSRRT